MPTLVGGGHNSSSASNPSAAAAGARIREKQFAKKIKEARRANRDAQLGAVEFGHLGDKEAQGWRTAGRVGAAETTPTTSSEPLGDAASGMMLLRHLTPARYDTNSSMGTMGTSVDGGGGIGGDSPFAMELADGGVGSKRALHAQHAAAAVGNDGRDRAVHQLLDRTGKIHCKQRKKLILANLDLLARDIPVDVICSRPLGDSLDKLSLAQNHLFAVPDRLVLELSGLHTLNLSQCDLTSLPPNWRLDSLRRLNLSHNRLEEF